MDVLLVILAEQNMIDTQTRKHPLHHIYSLWRNDCAEIFSQTSAPGKWVGMVLH